MQGNPLPTSPPDEDDADLTCESGPERTCIVTREKHSPDEMIRFVLSPANAVVPDIRRKLPGRGVWVLAQVALVQQAVKKQAFGRGFKAKVIVAPDLAETLDRLLEADALQSLSFANKAGAVLTGFVKVSSALAAGPVLALLNASDASADGLRKMAQAVRRQGAEGSPPAEINIFTSLQLDLALGRTNVIHAALKDTAAGAAFLARAHRLAGFRAQTGSNSAKSADFPGEIRPEQIL